MLRRRMPAYKRKIRLGVIVIMILAKLGAQGEKGRDYIFIPSFGGKSHRGEAPAHNTNNRCQKIPIATFSKFRCRAKVV